MSALVYKSGYGTASMVETTMQPVGLQKTATQRLSWVDCAKGLCIILVVMLHSTKGVGEAVDREGLIHYFTAFAKPFRMPDFFMISGLFLSRVINRDWKTYIDRKVLYFIYFYVLWATINFAIKSPALVSEYGILATVQLYLEAFIQPLGTLWFIYLLPVFFVLAKLLRRVNPVFVFTIAAVFEIATIETGWIVIDHTAERFVYFFAGYWLAPQLFKLAAWTQEKSRLAIICIAGWAIVNGFFVFSGYGDLPFISLLLGFLGAAAVVTVASLLSKLKFSEPIRYCGQNSIVIYLAFFIFMHATRIFLLEIGLFPQVTVMSVIITIAGIIGPLGLYWLVRNTKLSFLFTRPSYFSIVKNKVEQK